jgi:hypothetical protein
MIFIIVIFWFLTEKYFKIVDNEQLDIRVIINIVSFSRLLFLNDSVIIILRECMDN